MREQKNHNQRGEFRITRKLTTGGIILNFQAKEKIPPKTDALFFLKDNLRHFRPSARRRPVIGGHDPALLLVQMFLTGSCCAAAPQQLLQLPQT